MKLLVVNKTLFVNRSAATTADGCSRTPKLELLTERSGEAQLGKCLISQTKSDLPS